MSGRAPRLTLPAWSTQPAAVAVLVLAVAGWVACNADSRPLDATGVSLGSIKPGLVPPPQPSPILSLAGSESGVSDLSIRFGQSAVMSGSAREVGRQLRVGILAAFAAINRAGGVAGRRLELVTLDDAYEPEAAIVNTRRLIETEHVFGLIGATGTPTTRSAAPVALAAGVPYLAPVTGAAFLRAPTWTNVLHIRSSYEQEAEEIVARFTADLGTDRIGVLYQDDSFGRTGYRSVRLALERRGLQPVAVGIYPRNTTAVKTALLDLRSGDPDAVILIATFEPIVTLLEWAGRLNVAPAFATLSIGGRDLLRARVAQGVYVAQVFPDPYDAEVRAVAAYRDALRAHDAEARPGFHSLEGYLAGRVAAEGLARCAPVPTRRCFIERLRSRPVDIDGFVFDLGFNSSSLAQSVYLTRVGPDGRYEPVGRIRQGP